MTCGRLSHGGDVLAKPETLVLGLSDQQLETIGIQPQVVRSRLLQEFAAGGGHGKTIVLVDSAGVEEELIEEELIEEELIFYKLDFNIWIQANSLTQLLPDGTNVPIATWERLEEGGRYFTDKALDKQVSDMEGFQSLEDEVAERALADMSQYHPEAMRLCVYELSNKEGQSRWFEGIIVTDNCVKVVEVKSKVDVKAASELRSAIEFIGRAAEEGAPDLHFARRADGSIKKIKGALGGLRMVAGDQNQKALERTIREEEYDLYLPDGKQFKNGIACHPMEDPPSYCLRG